MMSSQSIFTELVSKEKATKDATSKDGSTRVAGDDPPLVKRQEDSSVVLDKSDKDKRKDKSGSSRDKDRDSLAQMMEVMKSDFGDLQRSLHNLGPAIAENVESILNAGDDYDYSGYLHASYHQLSDDDYEDYDHTAAASIAGSCPPENIFLPF